MKIVTVQLRFHTSQCFCVVSNALSKSFNGIKKETSKHGPQQGKN